MKNIILYLSIFCFATIGCKEPDVTIAKQQEGEDSIYGSWQLVERSLVAGVTEYWETVEDGFQYDIQLDKTFASNRFKTSNVFKDCTSGQIVLSDGEITFNYSCEEITASEEIPAGSFTYFYKFNEGQLILFPTHLNCVEGGCTFVFEKIAPPAEKG